MKVKGRLAGQRKMPAKGNSISVRMRAQFLPSPCGAGKSVFAVIHAGNVRH
jgi:hypothetical protein